LQICVLGGFLGILQLGSLVVAQWPVAVQHGKLVSMVHFCVWHSENVAKSNLLLANDRDTF